MYLPWYYLIIYVAIGCVLLFVCDHRSYNLLSLFLRGIAKVLLKTAIHTIWKPRQ